MLGTSGPRTGAVTRPGYAAGYRGHLVTPMSSRWIVTGGSRGVGLATARIAAARAIASPWSRAPSTPMHCSGARPGLAGACRGRTRRRRGEGAVEPVVDAWGGIDVLVNNAGLHRGGKVERLSPRTGTRSWRPTSPARCIACGRAAAHGRGRLDRQHRRRGWFPGLSGRQSLRRIEGRARGLTQVLAVELAPRRYASISSSPVWCHRDDRSARRTGPANCWSKIPLRRVGTEEEIAEVIWWVAGSTYMTGAVIPTDGGMMCAL